ncbi:MAG: HD-GYP domain-containing protein, partial [Cyanobium sp.]
MTTPEYVVDKATKLETIHDRIHEVRMRFELLKLQAESEYWQGVAQGGDPGGLARQRDITLAELDDDFSFVAACNQGGEFRAAEQLERLRGIAERRWRRTLDDRLGISHEERRRRKGEEPAPLPSWEPLLADHPHHVIPRLERERLEEGNPWGFRMEVPEHLYNRGELHNLSVARGTLSAEERFKINEHIIQTILMLSALPFPRHLVQVPEIAGGHHEMINGRGYPRGLRGEQMSDLARMMAIADIFEALTAADRPY